MCGKGNERNTHVTKLQVSSNFTGEQPKDGARRASFLGGVYLLKSAMMSNIFLNSNKTFDFSIHLPDSKVKLSLRITILNFIFIELVLGAHTVTGSDETTVH